MGTNIIIAFCRGVPHRIRPGYFLAAFLIICVLPRQVNSENGSAWRIIADQVNYDQKTDEYVAIGDVVMKNKNRQLTADFARYDKKNKKAYAEGNVVLRAGEDIISGESVEINLENETGIIYRGSVFIRATNFIIKAEQIDKVGEDKYFAKDGSLTTCAGDDPDWKITGSNIEIKLEGYGYVTHAALWAGKVPLFYSPFVIFPAKTKRQSGFLVPEFGYSDRKGAEYHQPYYWAIDRSSDATFYSHSMTDRGEKLGAEYRYLLGRGTMGTAMVDFLNDNEVDDGSPGSTEQWGYEDSGGQILRPNSDRYWFRMKHNQSLPRGVSAKLDLDVVSDQDYLIEFKGGYTGFEETDRYFTETFSRDIDDYDDNTRENSVNFNKSWTGYNLYTGMLWNDNVVRRRFEDTDVTLHKMPFVEFGGTKTKIGNTNFYHDLESEYLYFYRINGARAHRADIHPRIYWPYSYQNYFSFEPSIGIRETIWFADEYEHPDDQTTFHRELYDVELDLSTEVYNIFATNFFEIDKIKHAIRPQIVYNYIPDPGSEAYPVFNSVDKIGEQNIVTYSLTNLFTSRSLKKMISKNEENDGPPEYEYRQFCRFKLTQSYDINESYEIDAEPFSPVKGELDFNPMAYFSLTSDAEWSYYQYRFISHSVGAVISDSRGDRLGIEHRFKENSIETLKLDLNVLLTDRFNAYAETEQNLNDEKNIETIFGLLYTAQCWSLESEYSTSEEEQRYTITVNLQGLGGLGQSIKRQN